MMRKWLAKMAYALVVLLLMSAGAAMVCGAIWLASLPWPDDGWVLRVGACLAAGSGAAGGARLVFEMGRELFKMGREDEQPKPETTLWVVSDGVVTRRLNGFDLRVESARGGYSWSVEHDGDERAPCGEGWSEGLSEAMDAAEWAVRRIETKGGEA